MIHFSTREVERIAALPLYDLNTASLAPEYNDVAEMATDLLEAEAGFVTMVGLDQTWAFGAANHGSIILPRADSLCSHAILQDEPLVVGDLASDARFRDLPLVTDDPRLRFYAGAAVLSRDGLPLGAVCVTDRRPRNGITPKQLSGLQRLARIVGHLCEQRRQRVTAEGRVKDEGSLRDRALKLSGVSLWRADNRGLIESMDMRSPALVNLTREGFGPATWINYLHPDDVVSAMAQWRFALWTRQPFSAEFRFGSDRAGWRWYHARALVDPSPGRRTGWFGTLEDIDERRQSAERISRLEADLHHLSRVSAMGTMASTLAHELNQPLTAVANFVRVADRLVASSGVDIPHLGEAMEGAVEATMRAAGIIRGLRELVTRGDLQRRRVEVQPMVREAHRIALTHAPSCDIETRFHFDPAIDTVMVDPLQIQQVLVNLMRNAIQAMERTFVRRLTIGVAPDGDGECQITVRDTGTGIDPAVADNLFAPFSSTKQDGMGIGLAISRTIVEAHGGQIVAEPQAAGGTLFRLTLPLD